MSVQWRKKIELLLSSSLRYLTNRNAYRSHNPENPTQNKISLPTLPICAPLMGSLPYRTPLRYMYPPSNPTIEMVAIVVPYIIDSHTSHQTKAFHSKADYTRNQKSSTTSRSKSTGGTIFYCSDFLRTFLPLNFFRIGLSPIRNSVA